MQEASGHDEACAGVRAHVRLQVQVVEAVVLVVLFNVRQVEQRPIQVALPEFMVARARPPAAAA